MATIARLVDPHCFLGQRLGRESLPPGMADEALLIEAEALAEEAMRID